MAQFGSFERVYVENEWHDGPRAGVADIYGVPHRFRSLWDEKEGGYLSTFEVWPVSPVELELEIEQWCIFVDWNSLYESGQVDTDTHPGNGHNTRWNEIGALVKNSRLESPMKEQRATARLKAIDTECRYDLTGPNYLMCWAFL